MHRFKFQGERWSNISQSARCLVADMLHVAPQWRPTAAQLVKSLWVTSRAQTFYAQNNQTAQGLVQNSAYCNQAYLTGNNISNINEGTHLKESVAATFRAIATSPQVAHLGPVGMSELARRR